MTNEELRVVHVPEGCHLVRVCDWLDEGGPIVKVYERNKTPEEAARVRASIQRVVDDIYTRICMRRAAEMAAAEEK